MAEAVRLQLTHCVAMILEQNKRRLIKDKKGWNSNIAALNHFSDFGFVLKHGYYTYTCTGMCVSIVKRVFWMQ